MRYLVLILFLSLQHIAFSQDSQLKTFSGEAVEKTTCIFRIRLVNFIPTDTLNHSVVKPKIERLTDYLSSCDPAFTFDKNFKEKDFQLIVPKYLCKVSYELGDQKFAIVLRDTTSVERTIVFSYDFDDSYKKHFLTHDNLGFKKTGTLKLNGQIIHRFINWDESIAGTIFTANHLHVSYFTRSKDSEVELEEIISKFNW